MIESLPLQSGWDPGEESTLSYHTYPHYSLLQSVRRKITPAELIPDLDPVQ